MNITSPDSLYIEILFIKESVSVYFLIILQQSGSDLKVLMIYRIYVFFQSTHRWTFVGKMDGI